MHTEHMNHRGDSAQGMGFSHDKTKHTFRVLEDGGAIELRGDDTESVRQIRKHLRTIAKEFAAGNFARPRYIHDRLPDGAAVMKERRSAISYQYEELERGGSVRIRTKDAQALDAVHAFLKFQVSEHGE